MGRNGRQRGNQQHRDERNQNRRDRDCGEPAHGVKRGADGRPERKGGEHRHPNPGYDRPVLRDPARASPQITAPVMTKLSAPPSNARPKSSIVTDSQGVPTNAERQKVEQPGHATAVSKPTITARLAPAVGVVARPHARDQRGRELTARDETDHEGAEAKALMHMQRQHRQREANDQKATRTTPMIGSSALIEPLFEVVSPGRPSFLHFCLRGCGPISTGTAFVRFAVSPVVGASIV